MTTLIVMPGTGSDADFVRRVFTPAADQLEAELICLDPTEELISGYLSRLNALADDRGRLIVGGVSIGASLAVNWALDPANSGRCDGVLAALPPWSGLPVNELASFSARSTADSIDRDGLEATIETMMAGSPAWLGAELARSWRALHPRGLVSGLRAAASYRSPEPETIGDLRVPLGVAVAPDDPLHPAAVGRAWAAAAPRGAYREISLTEFGPDERLLGDACVQAWLAAASSPTTAAEPRQS